MLTITFLLTLTAFILAIASATGRVPLWPSVLLLSLALLLQTIPIR